MIIVKLYPAVNYEDQVTESVSFKDQLRERVAHDFSGPTLNLPGQSGAIDVIVDPDRDVALYTFSVCVMPGDRSPFDLGIEVEADSCPLGHSDTSLATDLRAYATSLAEQLGYETSIGVRVTIAKSGWSVKQTSKALTT